MPGWEISSRFRQRPCDCHETQAKKTRRPAEVWPLYGVRTAGYMLLLLLLHWGIQCSGHMQQTHIDKLLSLGKTSVCTAARSDG